MSAMEKSDLLTVAEKRANKAASAVAELVERSEQPTRLKSNRVQVPVPSIACIRTVSISGACGGNKAR